MLRAMGSEDASCCWLDLFKIKREMEKQPKQAPDPPQGLLVAHFFRYIQGGLLTVSPDYQNQNGTTCSANEESFYIEK